ncbi:MAG: DUF1934 domain-containing protein, partial [Clostridia bacterium]|nr:DUF1934 domain-containing protein [Clostridia bacterium]
MENNKFLISINGFQQTVGDTESENIELITEGEFEYEDGLYYIDYEESEATGMEGCHTNLEIGADYVSISRTGSVNTTMLYIQGRKTHSMYYTPYGEMLVGIYTKKLKINIDDNGGTLCAEYVIELNDKPCG